MDERLKPCPFCGEEATPVYCENGNQYTSNIMYFSKRGTIKCKHCGVRLPRIYSRVSKAVEAWNRRASIEPERKKGKWIDEGQYAEGHSQHAYYCSQCEKHYIGWIGEFNFCPNCGSDMRGVINGNQ